MSTRETCRCGRPLIIRPGDLQATCGECQAKPDHCGCGPVLPPLDAVGVSIRGTGTGASPGVKSRQATKQDRALDLARARYVLKNDQAGPYLLRDDQKYRFTTYGRRDLRADLKYAWRLKFDDRVPSDVVVNSVIDDIKRLALDVDLEPVTDDHRERKPFEFHPKDEVPEDGGISLVTAVPGCPLPDGYRIPRGYLVTKDDGTWFLHGRWGPSRVSWEWLFPIRVYADPDGGQWMELAWRDRQWWVTRLVRRSTAKSGRKLVMEIGDIGLPITDSEARDAEKWLAAAESCNYGVISRQPVARQLGWQNDGATFLTGQGSPWRVEPAYPDQLAALAAHRPHGSLKGWQKAVGNGNDYPVAQAGIYAGLAPVLLGPLSIDSFTVDIGGRSTRGKTITAAGGLSCWAEPSQKGDGMFSAQTSVIQAEKRLNLVNGLPVVLDETQLAKDPAVIETLLYEIPKNHGKPRGGGHPNMIPWRTIVISTGEKPITSFTSGQGVSGRVLSIQRPPFGAEGEPSRKAAEAFREGIEADYGIAGPRFAAGVQDLLSSQDGAGKLRQRHAELTSQLRGTTDMSGRRAPLIAVIVLAGELAHAWEITRFPLLTARKWLGLFSDDDRRDNRPEMALDIVREYITAQQDRLYRTGGGVHPPAGGWIGHHADEGPALLPGAVREELKRRGYDFDAVLPGWLETGALVTKSLARPPYMINRRTGGEQSKVIIFRREIIYPGTEPS